ncbi:hypothetical protein FRC07_010261 [Ceratobasidium sp. 392]|nr:hypothetical protein FRC07_010261 [Ceratobasidium sp. 392]
MIAVNCVYGLPDPNPAPLRQKWPDTPMYESLTTNVPHPIMFYPSYPAPPSTPLFSGSHVVNDYLQDYATRFSLRKYIKFGASVTATTWEQSISQWKVISRKQKADDHYTEVSYFDYLLITNGHRRHPFVPNVPGLEAWALSGSNSSTHSIWYRNPGLYRDLRVLVVGGGRSVVDISDEVSKTAKRVIHSSRLFSDGEAERTIQRGAISHFSSTGLVHFKSGSTEHVDRVIFATGYQYDYPFLTQVPTHEPRLSSNHLYNSGFHVYPLALHMFPLRATFPPSSLAFICATIGVTVFSLAEAQATLAIRQMSGQVSLDFNHELFEALRRNAQLRQYHNDSVLDTAQAWHKFEEEAAFDFIDLIWEKAGDSQRVPGWKRELMSQRYVMRQEWQALEQSDSSKAWVDDVGRGGIQEWIDFMSRIIKQARDRHSGITALSVQRSW